MSQDFGIFFTDITGCSPLYFLVALKDASSSPAQHSCGLQSPPLWSWSPSHCPWHGDETPHPARGRRLFPARWRAVGWMWDVLPCPAPPMHPPQCSLPQPPELPGSTEHKYGGGEGKPGAEDFLGRCRGAAHSSCMFCLPGGLKQLSWPAQPFLVTVLVRRTGLREIYFLDLCAT